MHNYGFAGGYITVILGFVLLYVVPPLGVLVTDILLFLGFNPRCGALLSLAAIALAWFIIGYPSGALVFYIKRKILA